MNVPVRLDFRTVFKLDELFKRGDLSLDKETGTVFFYRPEVHRENILRSPNNYRIAHKGDKHCMDITLKQRLQSYYYKLKYKIEQYVENFK